MKKYQVKINNMGLEIIQDDDGKFITPYLCIEDWGKFGTALKPSFEPIIVARKPFKGSLVDNVIEYGVGGINIDECRVEYGNETDKRIGTDAVNTSKCGFWSKDKNNGTTQMYKDNGRFPANTILTYDETDFDEVCGGFPDTKSAKNGIRQSDSENVNCYGKGIGIKAGMNNGEYGDSGSAGRNTPIDNAYQRGETLRKNTHPTVKPTELMQYLIRLVSPNGATILDPFNGSGSTGKAVMYENKERNKNYKYIGIELTEEYLPISKARIECLVDSTPEEPKEDIPTGQTSIFDFIGENND